MANVVAEEKSRVESKFVEEVEISCIEDRVSTSWPERISTCLPCSTTSLLAQASTSSSAVLPFQREKVNLGIGSSTLNRECSYWCYQRCTFKRKPEKAPIDHRPREEETEKSIRRLQTLQTISSLCVCLNISTFEHFTQWWTQLLYRGYIHYWWTRYD